MKNESEWKPSRFVLRNGRLAVTKDKAALSPMSRLNPALVLECYNHWIPSRARGRLLDLGCGTVPFYELYRPLVSDIFCVDWEGSLHTNKHVDLACDLSEPLAIDDEQFDTIILSSVLEHIPEPLQLFQEMRRVLKPGGTLLLNVPFLYWVHEAPHDYFRYTEFALRRFADRVGMTTEHLEPLGGAPYVLADMFAKTAGRARLVGKPLLWLSQGAVRLFVATPLGKHVCRATKSQMPSGYFMVASRHGGAAEDSSER